jgi:hypothetical protein
MNVNDLEDIIKRHLLRAKDRIYGLVYLTETLRICSFSSVRHCLLHEMKHPLIDGGHYLDNIQTCGKRFTEAVTKVFSELFNELSGIIKDHSSDIVSRLLALNIYGMAFQQSDASLFTKNNIISSLHETIIQFITKDSEIKKEFIQKQGSEQNVQEYQRILRSCVETAFFMLSAQYLTCPLVEDEQDRLLIDDRDVSQLQKQIFDFVCDDLKCIVDQTKIMNQSRAQNQMSVVFTQDSKYRKPDLYFQDIATIIS